jgi:hypothetical protein
MNKYGICVLALVSGIVMSAIFPVTGNLLRSGLVYAEADWKNEFEDICAKTQDAMSYTTAELRVLIDRSDKLKPIIEKLDATERKVYLKKLQICRDFFIFALDRKE